jgi:hypothetical protein
MNEGYQPARNTSSEFRQIALSILTGLILLVFEYWTGFFQTSHFSTDIRLNSVIGFLYTVCTVGSIWFISRCVIIWYRSYRYVREEYALAALLVLIFTSSLTILSFVWRHPPWFVLQNLITPLDDKTFASYDFRTSDFIAVISLQALITVLLFTAYRHWAGLKSQKQVAAQERGESPKLFSAAQDEINRIWKKEPPLEAYMEQPREYPAPSVDLSSKISQWKDQALQLFMISSTIYSFDPHTSWHEPPGCWIGTSRAGGLIVLYTVQSEPDRKTIRSVLQYARQILSQVGRSKLEFLVLMKDGSSRSLKIDSQLIRLESEDSIIERLLNLDDYKEAIKQRFAEDFLPESNLTLRDIYVRPNVTLDNKQIVDLKDYLQNWLAEPSSKQIVLLGEYGQGKSTAALALTYDLLFNSNPHPKRMPLLIELRGTSPATNRSTLGVLGDWGALYGLNPKLLSYMNDAGKLLIIFEGFDEMSLLGDADLRQRHFSRLWGFASPRSKVLLTGRPNLFRGKTEMEQALGLNRPIGESFSCEAIRLAFFGLDQIGQALRRYSHSSRQQIITVAKESQHFYDMVSRPSLLHIVAVLWEQEGLAEKVSRLNSAFVLDLFVRKSYRRPGRKDDPFSEYMILNSAERAYFMYGIAAYMVSRRLENQIDTNQLDLLIDKLVYSMPSSVSESVSATSGETRTPLLKRLVAQETVLTDRNDQLELNSRQKEQIRTDVRTCGLLVDDPSTQGHFRFPYKLFMEFLFAVIAADLYKSNNTFQRQQARSISHVTVISPQDVLLPSLTACPDFFAELVISDELDGIQQVNSQRPSPLEIKTIFAKKMLLLLTRRSEKFSVMSKLTILFMTFTMGMGFRGLLLASLLNFGVGGLLIYLAVRYQDLRIMNPGVLAVFIVALLVYLVFAGFTFNSMFSYTRSDLSLWAKLCKQQNVPPPIMHEMLGTKFFVRQNTQTFDFWQR